MLKSTPSRGRRQYWRPPSLHEARAGVGLLVSNILLRAHCDRNHRIRRMQGAAPGVRSVLSGAPGGSGKSTFGVATMSMVSVLTPGAALASDSPLCGLGIPGTWRPATAGRGSRAGDQLETSFREPMAVHPGADLATASGRPDREDQPTMPEVVVTATSRVSSPARCATIRGRGRPENAGVAGLPVCYSIQTMIDFRDRIPRAPTRAKPTPTGWSSSPRD